MLHRRSLLAAPFAATLARPALAQGNAAAWPSRPVRIIVGFPAGGSLDVMSRLMAERLQARTGQGFVVENRTGASGIIGMDAVAKAAPDGHTIGTIGMPSALIKPMLVSNLPYDAMRDFTYVSQVWEFPNVVVVPAQHVPARTLREFMDWAKARPGGVTYGSSGVGTTIHLCGALLLARAGAQGTHVAYRGAAQTIPAMLSGDVHLAVDNLASYIPVIREGRMRALAVTSNQRWPTLPDVPTMAEAGVEDFVVTSWHTWAVPAATPRPIVETLNGMIREVSSDPAVRARALDMGAVMLHSSPEETMARFDRERPLWAETIRISGAKV